MKLSRELEETSTGPHTDMCPEVKDAIEGAIFIANHLKEEDEFNRVSQSRFSLILFCLSVLKSFVVLGQCSNYRLAIKGDIIVNHLKEEDECNSVSQTRFSHNNTD